MIIVDEPPQVEDMMNECSAMFGDAVTVTRSKPIYLEFLHPSVNKGAGFEALCSHLEIPLEQTAAFGDSFNDIEMLQMAGEGIAVENAIPEVKAVVQRICPSNEENGVAQVLEAWLQEDTR